MAAVTVSARAATAAFATSGHSTAARSALGADKSHGTVSLQIKSQIENGLNGLN
jgi:hypothetical protein